MGSRISTPTPPYSARVCMYLAEPMDGPEGHADVTSSSSARSSPASGAKQTVRAEPPQPEDSVLERAQTNRGLLIQPAPWLPAQALERQREAR